MASEWIVGDSRVFGDSVGIIDIGRDNGLIDGSGDVGSHEGVGDCYGIGCYGV